MIKELVKTGREAAANCRNELTSGYFMSCITYQNISLIKFLFKCLGVVLTFVGSL